MTKKSCPLGEDMRENPWDKEQRLAGLLGFTPIPSSDRNIQLYQLLLDIKARLEKLEDKP